MTGLNVIDHRKFMIIDGITSVIGSLNIGDQYTFATPIQEAPDRQVDGRPLGIPAKEEEWHDGCFRIQGAVAQSLNAVFFTPDGCCSGEITLTLRHPSIVLR
ncbi:hypothetical protein ACFTAO_00820 [Paenibacillus rhizoplanae]